MVLPAFLPDRAELRRVSRGLPVEPEIPRRFCFGRLRLHLRHQPLPPLLRPLFLPCRVCRKRLVRRQVALQSETSHESETCACQWERMSFDLLCLW